MLYLVCLQSTLLKTVSLMSSTINTHPSNHTSIITSDQLHHRPVIDVTAQPLFSRTIFITLVDHLRVILHRLNKSSSCCEQSPSSTCAHKLHHAKLLTSAGNIGIDLVHIVFTPFKYLFDYRCNENLVLRNKNMRSQQSRLLTFWNFFLLHNLSTSRTSTRIRTRQPWHYNKHGLATEMWAQHNQLPRV